MAGNDRQVFSRSLLEQAMLPLLFPFSAWEFEQLARVSTPQVTSLVFLLVTQLQKTQGTVPEESSSGLS